MGSGTFGGPPDSQSWSGVDAQRQRRGERALGRIVLVVVLGLLILPVVWLRVVYRLRTGNYAGRLGDLAWDRYVFLASSVGLLVCGGIAGTYLWWVYLH